MSPPQEQDPGIASLDPMPGRVIGGNFRIDKLIGSGAMGNVYKALQISLGKPVAVKVLHHHLLQDERLVARFKREAKSASLLNHPNSIQIIDSGEDDDGTLYIAMELLTGRDLAQVIRDDFPMPLLRIGRIMTQVLSALDEAHAQGVVHRDLKPSNIMLIERRGERDFVKVCDFGIAKATLTEGADDRSAMLTVQGLVCGTPEYMSPEQARAEPLDGRADLYSAAVILYQLTTGDIPFRADSAMGIISRHLAEPPTPPSRRRPDLKILPAIDQIVLRGLEKNRELRFATEGDCGGLWDRTRITEVVSNLVSNALEHGQPGEPIDVVVRPEGDAVVFRIHNTGPPVPPESLPGIFDPFSRAVDGRPARAPGGASMGLGLYITREIVAAHGGDIEVRSSSAEGTTFTVRLPRGHRVADHAASAHV
jgi:serine/threonine protein kinase